MLIVPARTDLVHFDETTHVYTVAGVQRPSVTQILKDAGLIDTTWYTDEARERGKAVHFATQFLDEDDLEWDTVLPKYRGYVEAWERFKQESHFQIGRDSEDNLLIEYRLFHPVSGYCGMLDRLGTIGTAEYLLDIKTGEHQEWHGYQMAAYSQCLPNPHSRKRMTVHLRANGSYSTREHELPTFPYHWQVFAAATVIWQAKHRKRNSHGYTRAAVSAA
jgi:hypothetical protein